MKTIYVEEIELSNGDRIGKYPAALLVDNILSIKHSGTTRYDRLNKVTIVEPCTALMMKGGTYILIDEDHKDFEKRLKELD